MKLEELLKSKGYSEDDLKALAPLLSNDRYRGDLESTISDYAYQAEVGRADSAEALRWREEEALPKLTKALQDAEDARAESASNRERMRVLQEQGLIKVAENQGVKPEPKADVFDHKKYKLVTEDDQRATVERFADLEGDAIATGIDLAAEYAELYGGQSLHTYQGTGAGSGLRGFRALRKEAIAVKRPVSDFVADKFKFSDKRAEIAKAAEAKREEAIRADQRSKDIAELTNPMARPPQNSAFSMIPKPADKGGKLPWENEGDRSGARVAKAVTHLLQ